MLLSSAWHRLVSAPHSWSAGAAAGSAGGAFTPGVAGTPPTPAAGVAATGVALGASAGSAGGASAGRARTTPGGTGCGCGHSAHATASKPSAAIICRRSALLDAGGTQLLLQGGVNPDLPIEYYTDLLRGIKARLPHLHLKCFTAVEIDFFCRLTKKPADWVLTQLRDAGLDALASLYGLTLGAEERALTVGATETVPLTYDFWGFPQHYYDVTYDAPGAPALAQRVLSPTPKK